MIFLYKQVKSVSVVVVSILATFSFASAANVGTIDQTYHYTRICHDSSCTDYSTINFLPTSTSTVVKITDNVVSGYAWDDNLGWINFAPGGSGVFYSSGSRELSGYAWAPSSGWINFRPTLSGTISMGVPVGVSINSNNEWYGWAFASGINGGWIKFDCSNSATCVKVSWTTSSQNNTPTNQIFSSGGSYFVNTNNNSNINTTLNLGGSTSTVVNTITDIINKIQASPVVNKVVPLVTNNKPVTTTKNNTQNTSGTSGGSYFRETNKKPNVSTTTKIAESEVKKPQEQSKISSSTPTNINERNNNNPPTVNEIKPQTTSDILGKFDSNVEEDSFFVKIIKAVKEFVSWLF